MSTTWRSETTGTGTYAEVNGINLYYETLGSGRPLILLHGGLGSGEMFGPILPTLAAEHQVINVDLQGHGRTADVDRPLDLRLLADDIAALIDHLGLDRPHVVGYSFGGGVAFWTAVQHPEKVGKLVMASAHVRRNAIPAEMLEQQGQVSAAAAEFMKETPMYELYHRVAPRPEDFPILVEQLKDLDAQPFDWTADLPSIQAPTLTIIGDADIITPEHAVEMLRALGGGITGAMLDGSPRSQLAILPNTAHQGVSVRTELLLTVIPPFLDAPDREPNEATSTQPA